MNCYLGLIEFEFLSIFFLFLSLNEFLYIFGFSIPNRGYVCWMCLKVYFFAAIFVCAFKRYLIWFFLIYFKGCLMKVCFFESVKFVWISHCCHKFRICLETGKLQKEDNFVCSLSIYSVWNWIFSLIWLLILDWFCGEFLFRR